MISSYRTSIISAVAFLLIGSCEGYTTIHLNPKTNNGRRNLSTAAASVVVVGRSTRPSHSSLSALSAVVDDDATATPAVVDHTLGPLTNLKLKNKNSLSVDQTFPDDIDAIKQAFEAWRVSTASANGTPIKPFNQAKFDKFKIAYYKIAFEREQGKLALLKEKNGTMTMMKYPTETDARKAYDQWLVTSTPKGKPIKRYDKDEYEKFKVSYYKIAAEKARNNAKRQNV